MSAKDLTKQILHPVGSIDPDTYLDVNLGPEEEIQPASKSHEISSQSVKKYSTISVPPKTLTKLKLALLLFNQSTGESLGMAAFIERLLDSGFANLDKDAAEKFRNIY